MKTLEDAWQWYKDVKKSLKRINRVGARYWHVIPWAERPWRSDNHFIGLEAEDVTRPAGNGLQHLDDLAIVVLFSVFEAIARGTLLEQLEWEESRCQHPIGTKAVGAAIERVRQGSFFAVLELYKGTSHNNLVEEVNQVRVYRNWVAHGRRTAQPAVVRPDIAYERLTNCLALFFSSPAFPEEWLSLAAYYIWEKAGCPDGKQDEHWEKAKTELKELWKFGKIHL